eukprot:TRINITY_DN13510_c0_g1_i3.p3 TRINITY_DN13510_c0_g1~~TRINITY_DN13510_c0_g1_i3.p3  ORF type:complete len:103 (+),score=17.70 TRINITY_DN13510_c0_g1_i3:238-546(+)
MAAARSGRLQVVECLGGAGADVDAANWVTGRTALMEAAEHGHLLIVRALIGLGANLEACSKVNLLGGCAKQQRQTAVDLAESAEHWAIVDELVENGAHIERL